jgi:hypothetical protein
MYNSIVLLEEHYDHEELLNELGMSEEEYKSVMENYQDTVCCTFGK